MFFSKITYYVKLLAKTTDNLGYTTYVFENLEYTIPENKYIMCVRFPNWNQSIINLEDVGYVSIKYVEEGIDKWYDGVNFIPYKNTDIIFIKFVKKSTNIDTKEILLD